MRWECPFFSRHWFQRKPLVSDPGMHQGMCVTHVLWCMPGSLTRGGRENVPGILGACATHNFTYLVRGPWQSLYWMVTMTKRWLEFEIICHIFLIRSNTLGVSCPLSRVGSVTCWNRKHAISYTFNKLVVGVIWILAIAGVLFPIYASQI